MDQNTILNNHWKCDRQTCRECTLSIILPSCILQILKDLVYICEESGSHILLLVKNTVQFRCSHMTSSYNDFTNPLKSNNVELRTMYNNSEISDHGYGTKQYNIFVSRIISVLQNIKESIEVQSNEDVKLFIDEYISALATTSSMEHFKQLTNKIISYSI